jgi:hypothetical protein
VNGVPSCANDLFLNKVLRDQWGFEGFVVSDCGAISNIMTRHHYANTSNEACAAGIKGGCDSDCPGGNPPVTYFKGLADAVNGGALAESDVDQSLTRLWTGAIKLVHYTLLSYTLLSYTPLIHSSHTLLSYTPRIHSSHTLLSYSPPILSSHTLLSYAPLIHSSHTLLSYLPRGCSMTHPCHHSDTLTNGTLTRQRRVR